jgi:hypothetical protein
MHSVGGEVYWDGWFSGSPVIFPLVYECETRGIVMVHLTPAERSEGTSEERAMGQGYAKQLVRSTTHHVPRGKNVRHN